MPAYTIIITDHPSMTLGMPLLLENPEVNGWAGCSFRYAMICLCLVPSGSFKGLWRSCRPQQPSYLPLDMLARVVSDARCFCKALLQQYLAWANNAEGAVVNNPFQEGAEVLMSRMKWIWILRFVCWSGVREILVEFVNFKQVVPCCANVSLALSWTSRTLGQGNLFQGFGGFTPLGFGELLCSVSLSLYTMYIYIYRKI